MRLLFVRHGESEWNALGRWQGRADPRLSGRGREQARLAGEALREDDVVALVSSTLTRAIETAVIMSDVIGIGPVHLEADLVERDAGPWSGLTRDEIEAQFPGYLSDHRRPAGYEADEHVLVRTLSAVGRIVERYASVAAGATVAVITHGGIIYALERHLGAGFVRKPNLGARVVTWHGGYLRLGDAMTLLDAERATMPDLL